MRRSDMERDCTGVFGKKGSVMIIEMDNKFRGNAYIIKSDEVLLNYSAGCCQTGLYVIILFSEGIFNDDRVWAG